MPLIDPKPLWDFNDPATSHARFVAAADAARSAADELAAAAWLTQAARALGLQEDFDAAHALLDAVAGSGAGALAGSVASSVAGSVAGSRVAEIAEVAELAEVAARVDLERGRLHNSAGDAASALPFFRSAARRAAESGLDELAVDALHMVAIASPADERLARNEEALAAARASSDPGARNWDASILNNIGMVHADAEDFATALSIFEEALAARERIGDPARTRVARWMVGWSLRNLGRTSEALELQRALRAELLAAGESDPYVDEELAILEASPTQDSAP